ncbi:MAG: Carboxypeptidase Taq, partial [Thermoleophilia bacterium]|nr:Carboxypeptidase Taq [Thermoleophilia bacterium]
MTSLSPATAASWIPDEEATDAHRELRAWCSEFRDLAAAMRLLGWDQQTKLPPKGQAGRGRTMGALNGVLHERATSAELERLISNLEDVDPEGPEARVARRAFDQSTKFPAEHVRARVEASSAGYAAWDAARTNDDFAAFQPHLEKLLELSRKDAEYLGYENEPYDALHDLYEEGSRAADLE